jgi:hypothetical protein
MTQNVDVQALKEKQEKKEKKKARNDFSEEYTGKSVTIVLGAGNPSTLKGRVEAVSRYWVKVSIGQRVVYVNKAWIVSIEPAA